MLVTVLDPKCAARTSFALYQRDLNQLHGVSAEPGRRRAPVREGIAQSVMRGHGSASCLFKSRGSSFRHLVQASRYSNGLDRASLQPDGPLSLGPPDAAMLMASIVCGSFTSSSLAES